MSFNADTLYRLLPAIHRIRDAEQSPPDVLKALLSAIADEFAVLEENLDQLYDDLFIETCADWAIPYIGDLIGYEPLHSLGAARGLARAEVAHTLALRRRKGTAAVLEQLARDVTGWNARAVEFFQLLGATQYMNHLRPHSRYAPDLRRWEPLARIGGAFDTLAHTVDVRNIENGRGRFNIPNVGLFLWRLDAYRHSRSPAVRVDDRRYLISPLGHPLPLFTNPQSEDEITHLADPINVPDPIRRRVMAERLPLYCATRQTAAGAVDNADPSVALFIDGVEVPRAQIVVCNLADDGAAWAHDAPAGQYAIDPELGRIAVAPDLAVPGAVATTYHYGFSADMGGGEYSRARADDATGVTVLRVPDDHATIAAALAALAGDGIVEIADSGRYEETLSINVAAGGHVVVRAADDCRPTLILGGEMTIRGGLDSACTLEGLLVAGERVRVENAAGNALARLNIGHATLVPGRALDAVGEPATPDGESLVVEIADVAVEIDHAIVGALRIHAGSSVAARDSIVDALKRVINPIWNAYYFLTLYGNADKIKGEYVTTSENILDQYILAKTARLIANCQRAYDSYDLFQVSNEVEEFLEALTNWYIRRSRDRFWRETPFSKENDLDKVAAYNVLHSVLLLLTQVTAPMLPMLTEYIYKGLTGGRSVHLTDWPTLDLPQANDDLVDAMDLVREACSQAHSIRKARGLRARLPLASLTIATENSERLRPFINLIMQETNVKAVELVDDPTALARETITLVPRLLGPRLGGSTQSIINAAKAGDFARDEEGQMVVGGTKLLEGEYIATVDVSSPEASRSLFNNSAVVVLDIEPTPQLIAEGTARDFIRSIQSMRKDENFNITDRITVEAVITLASERHAIEEHLEMIKAQTLADEIKLMVDETSSEWKISVTRK